MVLAVGVFRLDGDGFALVGGFEGVAVALPYFFAVGKPAVFDATHAVIVLQVVGSGQFFAHFGGAADGDVTARRVVWCGRRRGGAAIGDFRRFRALYRFGVVFAVGVFRFDGDGFAFVGGLEGVTVALPYFFAIGKPAVFDAAHAVRVLQVIRCGQFFAHFGGAADGDVAARRVVRRAWRRGSAAVGDCRRFRAFYGFGVVFAVGVFRLDGDGFALVSGFEGVAVALPDFFAVGKPAVFDAAHAVRVLQVIRCGQFFAHFGGAADGDVATRRVVWRAWRRGRGGRRRCQRGVNGGAGLAGEGFVVAGAVFVFDVDGEGFAAVYRLDGVAASVGAGDGVAVGKPLVFDVFRLHAVRVFHVRNQGLADFGRADELNFAFLVVGGIGVFDGDFGAVVAGVAVAVGEDVFDRIGVALVKVLVRGEGDVAAASHRPHALFVHDEAGDALAVLVQQLDGVRVDVALGVGVVFDDVDGDFAATVRLHGVVIEYRLVGFQVRVGNARMSRHLWARIERVGRRVGVGLRHRRRVRHGGGSDGVADDAGGAVVRLHMVFAVGVADVHADVFATVSSGDGVAFAGRAGDGVAFGKPLVFDGAGLDAVVVGDNSFQRAADFCLAFEQDGAGGVRLLCRVVGEGDFRRFAGVAFGVADGVLHRGRVAGKARFRLEGDVAVEGDVPFAFTGDFQRGDRAPGGIEQTDAVDVDVGDTVGVGVVFQHVNGDGFAGRGAFFVVSGDRRAAGLGLVGVVRRGAGTRTG